MWCLTYTNWLKITKCVAHFCLCSHWATNYNCEAVVFLFEILFFLFLLFCSICWAKPCHSVVGSGFYHIFGQQKSSYISVTAWFSERKTRLELATPTLARLCSTNWAISAFDCVAVVWAFPIAKVGYIILLGQGCALPTELFPHLIERGKPFVSFCECKYRAKKITVQEICEKNWKNFKKFLFLPFFTPFGGLFRRFHHSKSQLKSIVHRL